MSSVIFLLYKRILLYIIFIQRLIVVNFNVSSINLMHMLDFLDTFNMGVTVYLHIIDNYEAIVY